MALSLDDARRRTRLHARSLIDAVERDRPLWVRLGRKLNVRIEFAIPATTDIVSVVTTSGR